jgi:hypothetical protein
VNYAVAIALEKWTGQGDFEKLVKQCLFIQIKTWLRDGARRDEKETRATDLVNDERLKSAAERRNVSVWELIEQVPDSEVRRILDDIAYEGRGVRDIENERRWRNGTGVTRLRDAIGVA